MSTHLLGSTPLLDQRYFAYLNAYLTLTGWKVEQTPLWNEYLGPLDSEGAPLLLVLPRNHQARDAQDYVTKAIELLSALQEEPVETVALRVQHVHSDVFITKNLETSFYASISLRLADTQVSELKSLVATAARAEREPRPYFQTTSAVGQRMVEQFRFGHTIKGSFGMTVEAPLIHEMELYVTNKDSAQPPLLQDLADYIVATDITMPPIERRIVERLVRGMITTHRSVEEQSIQPLITDYGSGFNANMCTAVSQMGKGEGPIEYQVLWSPKFSVSEDITGWQSTKLDEPSYMFLEEASRVMRVMEPDVKRIRGIVTHVGSNVPPRSEDNIGRQVIIKWLREDSSRSASIIVPLNRKDYMEAHKAHLDWSTVEVTGSIVRTGGTYRLLDATDFQIVNP